MKSVFRLGIFLLAYSFCLSNLVAQQSIAEQLKACEERMQYADDLISSEGLGKVVFVLETDNGKARRLREGEELTDYVSLFTIHFGESAFRVDEEPFCMSGDWYERHSHYFDGDGATIGYTFYSATFSSGCAEIAKVTVRKVLDAKLEVIQHTTEIWDQDGNPLEESGCDLRMPDRYRIRPSFQVFRKEIGF